MRRAAAGEYRPFTLAKPYRVEFTLRRSYPDSVVAGMARVAAEWGLEQTGPRAYRFVTSDARQMAYVIDAVEGVVLP